MTTHDENKNPDAPYQPHPALRNELQRIFNRIKTDFGDQPEPSQEPEDDLRQVGDFRIIREIGSGGMAIVYEAEQISLKRRVALKVLPSHLSFSDEAIRKFQQEAVAGGRASHPGIVAVHAVGEHEGRHFMAQEIVEGGYTLADRLEALRESGDPPVGYFREIVKVITDVARALGHAHAHNVIHRDVKPSNILLTPTGQPKVTDFGLARIEDALTLSRTGQVVGTPYYMSPEQTKRQSKGIDFRTDIFSLGVTLYESLTLAYPFDGDTAREVLEKILLREPRDPRKMNPRVPVDLAVICLKALEKKPENRYATMNDFADDLERFLNGEVILARPVLPATRLWRLVKRNPSLSAMGGLALLAVAVLVFVVPWILVQKEKDQRIAVEAEQAKVIQARNEAVQEKNIAVQERAIKEKALADLEKMFTRFEEAYHQSAGLNLITQAGLILDTNPDQAIILAYEGALRNPSLYANNVLLESMQSCRQIEEFGRHQAEICDAAFSPDGNKIVTASWDHTARVWDTRSGETVSYLIGHDDGVPQALFMPDAERVVTVSWDNTARIWNSESGDELFPLVGHDAGVTCADISADGSYIVTGSHDETARIWKAHDGKPYQTLVGHEGPVNYVRFSPDGSRILTASDDGTARIWDVVDGNELTTLIHDDGILHGSFSPGGNRVVTASMDSTARIWDIATGLDLTRLVGHESMVNIARFSDDGRFVITASDDNMARLWNSKNGDEILTLVGHEAEVTDAALSSDGLRAFTVSTDQTLRIWEVRTGEALSVIKGHERDINSLCFSPDGLNVLTASDDGTARLWNVGSGHGIVVIDKHRDDIRDARFSPDGRRAITASDDKTARIWDTATGEELLTLGGHDDYILFAQYSPEGSRVITASDDGTAQIWDANSGEHMVTLDGHYGKVRSARFSPDGLRVVTASTDGTARIWDVSTGENVLTIAKHNGAVHSARFSADGLKLITGSMDNTAAIWNAYTGERLDVIEALDTVGDAMFASGGEKALVMTYNFLPRVVYPESMGKSFALEGHGNNCSSTRFSPDGKKLVTASRDKTARIWDAETGAALAVLEGHEEALWFACFSHDGKWVITTSGDKTARLWDAKTGTELVTYRGHTGLVVRARFSSDDTKIITWSLDGTVRIWPTDLIAAVRPHIHRGLTPEEKKEYRAWTTEELRARLFVDSLIDEGLTLQQAIEHVNLDPAFTETFRVAARRRIDEVISQSTFSFPK